MHADTQHDPIENRSDITEHKHTHTHRFSQAWSWNDDLDSYVYLLALTEEEKQILLWDNEDCKETGRKSIVQVCFDLF